MPGSNCVTNVCDKEKRLFIDFLGNVDYNETQAVVTFPNGTRGGSRLAFSIPIIEDNIAEYFEQIRVTASARGSGIGIYTRLTYSRNVRIYDDDRELIKLFARPRTRTVYFVCLFFSAS